VAGCELHGSEPPRSRDRTAGRGNSWTFNLQIGGVDTSLTCTIGGVSDSCVSSGTALIPPTDDGIALNVTTTGTGLPAAVAMFGWQAA
jgi:hypothetical protein